MKRQANDFLLARRFRTLNRFVQILLSISLIVALNYLAAVYYTRIDLTETGAYSLAPESKAYVRGLEREVEIIVTIPKDPDVSELKQIHRHLSKLLRAYEAAGRIDGQSMVEVEYVDIYRQRSRAQQLANQYGLTRENIILVASGDRSREIRQGDLYEVEGERIVGFRGEKAITSAIIEVASDETRKLYFLVGHGEMRLDDVDPLRGLSQLEAFLRERNHSLATLDLSIESEVPEDADLVVVPSPQASLLPEEVEKLRRYMSDRNGRMVVLIDPGRRHGMDDLFFDWGILADDMVVVDAGPDFRARGGDLIISRFAEHPITELLLSYQIKALFGQPRPVRIDPVAADDERLEVTQLIGTSEQSWAERDYRNQSSASFDPQRDIQGPIPIASVSSRSAGSGLGITIPGGRLAVFGNSDFIANNRLRAFGNRTLFFNTLNWTLDRLKLLNIRTRPLESHQIILSKKDQNRMLLYFAIPPAAVGLFGLFIYILRRR